MRPIHDMTMQKSREGEGARLRLQSEISAQMRTMRWLVGCEEMMLVADRSERDN
jgi:hypothetical protein